MNCRFCTNKNDDNKINCSVCGKVLARSFMTSLTGAPSSPPDLSVINSPSVTRSFDNPTGYVGAYTPARSTRSSGNLISDTGGNVPFGPTLPDMSSFLFNDNVAVNNSVTSESTVVSDNKKSREKKSRKKPESKSSKGTSKKDTKSNAPMTSAQLKEEQFKKMRNFILIVMLLILAFLTWYMLLYNKVISCDFIPKEFIYGTITPLI